MRRLRTLGQLTACLQEKPADDCDWAAVVGLANQSLITPQLAASLASARSPVPEHVTSFLQDVQDRNRVRNARIWTQLTDAVRALNNVGITPVLLKGATLLARCVDHGTFNRVLSDIDLLIAPNEVPRALAGLQQAGFQIENRYPTRFGHVVAELGRPQDVGYLDLHQRAPGPAGIADADTLKPHLQPIRIGDGRAKAPSDAFQLLHFVLHDQFHDGDYWRGGFDLRHLIDVAELVSAMSRSDWSVLHAACKTKLARSALNAYVLASERIVGRRDKRAWPGLKAWYTYGRWMLQYACPRLRLPLALAALAAEWPDVLSHRSINQSQNEKSFGTHGPKTRSPRVFSARLGKIFTVHMGKV